MHFSSSVPNDRSPTAKVVRGAALLYLAASLGACAAGERGGGAPPENITSTTAAISIGPSGHALDYFQCATQGGSCAAWFKYVAFGANGSFIFRNSFSFSSIPCTTSAFGGDPAPGVTKACYAANYSPGPSENSSGTTNGPRSIAYGANGAFNVLTIDGAYTCDNATFGDPIPGVGKTCYSALDEYGFGAMEGDSMSGLFNIPVAYGANGSFVYSVVSGADVPCTNDFFGADPAVGITKTCYRFNEARIADEGQHFNAGGPYVIEYGSGLNGNFLVGSPRVDNPSQASGTCDNTTFGGDPDIGPTKHCYTFASSPSCGGFCGGQSPGGCWCDDLCIGFGDCCADFTVQNCGT